MRKFSLAVIALVALCTAASAQQTVSSVVGLAVTADEQHPTFRFVGPNDTTYSTEPKTLKVTSTNTDLTVDMTDGVLRVSQPAGRTPLPPEQAFKTLQFTFVNGKLRTWKLKGVDAPDSVAGGMTAQPRK